MIRLSARLTIVFGAFFVLCAASLAYSEGFVRYCNPRYGFCVEHPGGLSQKPDSDNGDGRTFFDSYGFQLIAAGGNNVLDAALQTEMRSQSKDFQKITYQVKRKNWFVLSGYIGSDIAYRKTYVGKGSINSLYIRYPAKLNAKYSDAVTRISQSFKPGNLDDSH